MLTFFIVDLLSDVERSGQTGNACCQQRRRSQTIIPVTHNKEEGESSPKVSLPDMSHDHMDVSLSEISDTEAVAENKVSVLFWSTLSLGMSSFQYTLLYIQGVSIPYTPPPQTNSELVSKI